MSKRYSGKSFKDSSVMKKPKLSIKEKRKKKKEKNYLPRKNNELNLNVKNHVGATDNKIQLDGDQGQNRTVDTRIFKTSARKALQI